MAVDFQTWASRVTRLDRALAAIAPLAATLDIEPTEGEEWRELLVHKLVPQVSARPLLVAAIVGGTNIGKSSIFNQLAGEVASTASPLAAGTRHPVCLVPSDLRDEATLAEVFSGFELRRWRSAEDPLIDANEHRLFWRESATIPPRLLLVDTPDIDSDAPVNWQRADTIRQSADVLIAVLTQQKYNDAAVKQFFRKAAEADKPFLIVFNQCDLEEDRAYWPLWLNTFARETHARPEGVYVVPYDRQAANEQRLPFFRVASEGEGAALVECSLRDDLASLRFDQIKIRTFRGALARVLDRDRGVDSYLERIRAAAGEFAAAAQALSVAEMARIGWPVVPPQILIQEIRDWWDARRSRWSRNVHGVYRAIGQGATWPLRAAWRAANGTPTDPLELFRQREREAIVTAIEQIFGQLNRLQNVGNEMLRLRLQALLSGHAVEALLERVLAAHAELPPLDDDYREYLRTELDRWGRDNERAVSFLRSLDHVAAVARPAITVVLVATGAFVGSEIVGQTALHVAGSTAGNLAAEAAIAGGITVGGEAVVSVTGEGVRQAAGRLFRRLQVHYATSRAEWLSRWLEEHLLGALLNELRAGADVPNQALFLEVEAAVAELAREGV